MRVNLENTSIIIDIMLKGSGYSAESRAIVENAFLSRWKKRDEQTLLPIIQKWIKPETMIISDCWKVYCNLEKHGYMHRTVNHSIELVNDDGDSTNKMEGHWRHTKVKMSPFSVRTHHFS